MSNCHPSPKSYKKAASSPTFSNSYSYKSFDFSWKKGGFYRLVNLTLAFLCIISLLILAPTKRMLVSEIVLVPVENRHSVTGRNDQKLTNEKSHYQIRSEVLK